jgi:hypothetical protein
MPVNPRRHTKSFALHISSGGLKDYNQLASENLQCSVPNRQLRDQAKNVEISLLQRIGKVLVVSLAVVRSTATVAAKRKLEIAA